jgi:alkylation response protein AidB-like acyl-CoA dehydrogenase
MDLLVTEEQQQIVDSIRDVLRNEFVFEKLCANKPPFADGARSLWQELAELGWFGLALAENAGGVGLTVAEECLLFREAGRSLVSPALLAVVLAAHTALLAGMKELAEAFASGKSRPGLLLAQEPLMRGREVPVYVADAATADWVIAIAPNDCILVPCNALFERVPTQGIDSIVPLEKATLDVARAELRAGADLALRAQVLVAAMLTGVAEGARDMATAYATVREQFGKPIGSFQSIKHRCADMAVACEVANSQTSWSAVKVRDHATDAAREAAAALLLAQMAAEENAAANIQIHGAMGFTEEGGAHHFLKRALLLKHVGAADALRGVLLG